MEKKNKEEKYYNFRNHLFLRVVFASILRTLSTSAKDEDDVPWPRFSCYEKFDARVKENTCLAGVDNAKTNPRRDTSSFSGLGEKIAPTLSSGIVSNSMQKGGT